MSKIIVPPSAAVRARNLLQTIQANSASCPCHGCRSKNSLNNQSHLFGQNSNFILRNASTSLNTHHAYAFEMASSNVRFGLGATREVGLDFKNKSLSHVAVFTDSGLLDSPAVQVALESLDAAEIKVSIFHNVHIEPKDYSVREAIKWARNIPGIEGYLAIGGGSVIDTAKIANLFDTYNESVLEDFVNAPLGKGNPIDKELKPLIAIPTTSGTGSETTGTAIFDYENPNTKSRTKTGISGRRLKPVLGIVDPKNSWTMNKHVRISSALDVLCHSIESYTAIPYNTRTIQSSVENPSDRPTYQGANPISDIFSLHALKLVIENLPIIVKEEPENKTIGKEEDDMSPKAKEAASNLMLAATLAGIGFGNAGVHLCHGLSYPISSLNHKYVHPGYKHLGHPIVPHGVSVAISAPAVFKFTGASNPKRHLEIASLFGVDISKVKAESDVGSILSDALAKFLSSLGDQPKGLGELGFNKSEIPQLIQGALPQKRILGLAPLYAFHMPTQQQEDLAKILENTF